jgi:hypothetical protein
MRRYPERREAVHWQTKPEDNTPNRLELSGGQREVHVRRVNLAHARRIYREVARDQSRSPPDFRRAFAFMELMSFD